MKTQYTQIEKKLKLRFLHQWLGFLEQACEMYGEAGQPFTASDAVKLADLLWIRYVSMN